MSDVATTVRQILSRHAWLWLLGFGGLSALAHAPTYWVWLLPLCFGGALWLIWRRDTALGSIRAAQLFALGHFAVGMYWLAAPLYTAPQNVPFGLVGSVIGTPIAVLGIPAVIGLCFAVPLGLTVFVLKQKTPSITWQAIALLALAWACGDWLRSWVLTGLPWNVTAYVWGWSPPMMQMAAWVGPFGLSFVTALVAFLPALWLDDQKKLAPVGLVGGCVLALMALSGFVRLNTTTLTSNGDVLVGLIQPAARQALTRTQSQVQDAVDDLVSLSEQLDQDHDGALDIVIWSEAATGLELYRNPGVNQKVRDLSAHGGPAVLTGSAKLTYLDSAPGDLGSGIEVTNSLTAVSQGGILADHDKAHLVPFGEYMPLRQLLTLPNLSLPGVDYAKGSGIQTLRVPGLPAFSPLICYEAIFPGRVIDRERRPTWMVNITTDAWFGNTSGPRQHLVSVRFRSVEEGLPMARVAGAGISAMIDPFGRVVKRIDLNERRTVAQRIPGFLKTPTLYASGGQAVLSILFWVFLCWLVLRVLNLAKKTLIE